MFNSLVVMVVKGYYLDMFVPDLTLQKPLEEYIELFEKMTARSLLLFDTLLDEGCVFEDPYHKVLGALGFATLMRARFALYRGNDERNKSSLRYRVHDFAWGRRDDTAYIYWGAVFESGKGRGRKSSSFEGVSEVCLSKRGKILSQRDFWSAHEGFDVKGYKAIKL